MDPSDHSLAGVAAAAFEETPLLGKLIGWVLAVALVVAIFAWIVFGLMDIARRTDIGRGVKLLWLAAFVLSAGVVLVIYGAVRFSATNGEPG